MEFLLEAIYPLLLAFHFDFSAASLTLFGVETLGVTTDLN